MMLRRKALVIMASVSMSFVASFSGMAGEGDRCCPECGCATCVPVLGPVKETKTAYRCECKVICIPSFKNPFAPCCEPPPPGKPKTVRVIKKVEYECEKCGYTWKVTCCGEK